MAEKKIIELQQSSVRIKEILDATDEALIVQDSGGNPVDNNLGKIWTTSKKEVDNNGEISFAPIIEMKSLSDLEEYKSIEDTTIRLDETINNEEDGILTQLNVVNDQLNQISNILGDDYIQFVITPIPTRNYSVIFKNKQDLVIKYKFKSVGSAGPTGPGTVTWKMGNTILAEETIYQNTTEKDDPNYNEDYNIFDFSQYAHVGKNEITGVFNNQAGSPVKEITWTINAVELSLNIIDFNKTKLYDDSVSVKYQVVGLGENDSASVVFQLDKQTPSIISFSSLDVQKIFTVAKQSHGSHLLSIHAEATINGTKLSTDKQFLDLMFVEDGEKTPIIRWPYDESLILEQYNAYDFDYSVYDPQNPIASVKRYAEIKYIDNNTQQEITTNESWANTANWEDSDEQSLIWTFTPEVNMQKKKPDGTVTLTIECGEGDNKVTKTKTFQLQSSSLNINPIVDQLVLDFNPKGRTNQDTNYNIFKYENKRHTTNMTVSNNFNWTHGGWKKDEQGQDVFIVKTGTRMYLDYPLFAEEDTDAKTEGRHIKLTYKATNCASFDAAVMGCNEYQGRRHEITPERFYLDEDGEIQSIEENTRYFLDGYNVHEETNEMVWEDGIIGGTLITENYDKDERDEKGIGYYYHISTAQSYVGLEVKAQEALLHSSYNDLPLVYCEDEKMSLSVDVEKSGDSEARLNLMTGYVDSDPIRVVKYDASTSFVQKEKQLIEFGSDECDVLIYRFKIYTRHLNNQRSKTEINEVFDDYIADIPNASDRLAEYNRNDFLNTDGTINIEKLQEKCPGLRIVLITCPKRFTIDKDDKVKGCTVEHILAGSSRPEDHWIAENVQLKGQGTSSNAYGTSARNMDIKLNKLLAKDENGNVIKDNGKDVELNYSLIYWDENGEEQHSTKYSMTEGSIPVNYFNIKVNVASSECANNACLADWFNTYDPYERPVKQNGVRDTMEFHPCVVFIREASETEWVEFEPEYDESNNLKYHFYSCGDFGNSKKNHDTFGMGKQAELDVANAGESITIDGIEYPLTTEQEKKDAIHKLQLKECIVEFSNNTHPVCLFEKPNGWDDILPDCFDFENMQVTKYADFWSGDALEFRYPEDVVEASFNKDSEFDEDEIAEARERLAVLQPQVQRLWRWVESTDPRKATGQELNPPVELITPSTVLSERIKKWYTHDTEEYRKAKFLTEYENYFEKDSMLFHYLFTDRYLMIDNRVKNVFLHTTDGLHWDFCFNYDDDTALGCENSGFLTLDYNLEDCDQVNGIDVYNGNSSVLWENVRTILIPELKSMYNNDKCKDAWSASALLGKMTNYQSKKPALLEMIDMHRKYIRPYKIGHGWSANKPLPTSEPQYLERLNGRKKLQRKRFETYRDIYTGSKYQSASFSSSNNDITFRVNKNGGIMEITPYCDMYPAIKWGDSYYTPTENKRVRRNEKCYIDLTPGGTNVGNQELHFCGASMLSDLGPLAKFQIYEANFNNGTKLKRILFGDNTGANSSNVTITTMSLPTTPLLEEVDVSYTQYANELNFTNQPMIKKVYCKNSKVPMVTFAENGIVETAHLNALSKLQMNGLTKLKDFSMLTDMWTSVDIQNTPYLTTGVKAIEFINSMPKTISGKVEGLNVKVLEDDINIFDRFIKENKSNLILSGSAEYDLIYESQTKQYNELWPNLDLTWSDFIKEFPVYFKDYDGTIVETVYVTSGQTPAGSIDFTLIKPNPRPATESTIYTFDGWDGNFNTPVLEPTTFTARYTEEIREYKVVWWKDKVNGVKLDEGDFKYGSNAEYKGVELKSKYEDIFQSWSLFSGWNKSTAFVKPTSSDNPNQIDVVAQWEDGSISAITRYVNDRPEFIEGFDTRTLRAAQIYTIMQTGEETSYFGTEGFFRDESEFLRLKIALGDRLSYNTNKTPLTYTENGEEKEITFPCTFNGDRVIKTNNNLLQDINKGWTLFVDLRLIKNQAGSLLLSCLHTNSRSGFAIAESTEGYPYILNCESMISTSSETQPYWSGTNSETDKSKTFVNTSGKYLREVFVIVHKPGEKTIHTYCGMLDQEKPQYKELTLTSETAFPADGNLSIILGGTLNNNRPTALGKGVIHHCELWDEVLNEEECKALTLWPREDAEFMIIDFARNSIENTTQRSKLDIMAAQSTWAAIRSYLNEGKGTNFFDSYVYTWLNSRYYNALPIQWKNLLLNTNIPYVELNDGTPTIQTNKTAKIWIPSAGDMGNPTTEEQNVCPTIPLFSGGNKDNNMVFTPGCPLFDIFPTGNTENPVWYKESATEPENAQTGWLWLNTNTNKKYINYYGLWINFGGDGVGGSENPYYMTRTPNTEQAFHRWWLYNTTSVNWSTSTGIVSGYLVPCFSI